MTTCGTVGTVPGVFCLCSVVGGVPGCVEFVSVKVLYPFPQCLYIIFLLPDVFSHKHPVLGRGRFIAPITDYAVSKNTTDDDVGLYTVTLSRSEGSVWIGDEMLRGVYPERSEWAQHGSAVCPNN